MTRAFPVFSAEQKELILLRDIASYLLLVCGAVYIAAVSLVNNTFPNLFMGLGREVLYVSAPCLLHDLCCFDNPKEKIILSMLGWRYTYFSFFGLFLYTSYIFLPSFICAAISEISLPTEFCKSAMLPSKASIRNSIRVVIDKNQGKKKRALL